jgi:cytochrome oxidase Cu insertion factor (SCO1/SenC/PrrC family)
MVGMTFDSVDDVEKFYKSYVHESGFSVRIGQHKKQNEDILIKRYYCSRESYRKEKDTRVIDQSKKNEDT